MVTKTVRTEDPNNSYGYTRGPLSPLNGSGGNDRLNAIKDDSGQIHVRGLEGNDVITLSLDYTGPGNTSFAKIGHQTFHVYAGPGADQIRINGMKDADHVLVGRLDDLNLSEDRLFVDGTEVFLKGPTANLPTGVDVVSFNGQQWLRIGDNAIFALEGARLKADGSEERHFTTTSAVNNPVAGEAVLPADLSTLNTVNFVDQVNFVPLGTNVSGINWNVTSAGVITGGGGVDYIYAEKNSGTPGESGTSQSIYGGNGNDVINANSGDDYVRGGNDNDRIAGGLDDDRLYGDAGNDQLWGGSEDDKLYGGTGADRMYGGSGNDYLRDDSGSDKFYGGSGSDTVSYYGWYENGAPSGKTLTVNLQTGTNNSGDTYSSIENVMGSNANGDHLTGSSASNKIWGQGGNDTLIGSGGNDSLYGGTGTDRLSGGSGADRLYGGADADRLYGGSSSDRLYGGSGNDYLRDDSGSDKFYGGSGSDTVSYYGWYENGAPSGKTLTVNLQTGTNNSGDTYSSIENVMGSNANGDHLTGSSASNEIWGQGGSDTLIGSGGNDSLYGGDQGDKLYGGSQNDKLYGGDGWDYLYGGSGNDVLTGGSGKDKFVFTNNFGDDVIKDFDTVDYERIDLSAVTAITNLSDLKANHLRSNGDGDAVIFVGGDTITLEDISVSDFNSGAIGNNDFFF